MDLLAGDDEAPAPGEMAFDPSNPMRHARIPDHTQLADLRAVVMEGGRRTQQPRPLEAIADYARKQLARLPEGCRRLLNPHVYKVALTAELHRRRERMIEEASTIGLRGEATRGFPAP